MQSPLELDTYLIDHIDVSVNVDFDPESEMTADVSLFPSHLTNNDRPEYHQLVLDVRFSAPEDTPKSYPYSGRIVGRGVFHVGSGATTPEEAAQLVLVNGTAILLGLLRAHISQVTALGLHGQLLLPAMNIVQAWEEAATAAAANKQAEPED
jgi:preprotein translocase subunit SecB